MFFKTKQQCKIIRGAEDEGNRCFVADDEGNLLFNFDETWSDAQVWKTLDIANKAYHYGSQQPNYRQKMQDALTQKIELLEERLKEKENSEKLLQAVYKISELTSDSSIEIDDFYQQIHEVVGELVDASNFYICKTDTAERNLDFVYFRDGNHAKHPSREMSDGFTELVIRSGNTVLLSRKDMEDLCARGITKKRIGVSDSWLGVPLVLSDKIVGVVVVQSYVNGFMYSKADVHLLTFVSQHVSTAIKRREEAEFERQEKVRLEFAAKHDELTQLPNRQAIYSAIDVLMNGIDVNCKRAFSVLFIDLDGFKLVNDSFGHQVGDSLLMIVANKLKSIIRTGDTVGRLGGDEFIIVLSDMLDREPAYEIANRIVSAFAKPLRIEGCEVSVGASIGIAHSDAAYQSADEILRAADEAMYNAKALGKNRYQEFV
ncbi:diguanylate cyclase domain-containing protein [Neptunicella sp. SCSIO 80796]|uniref:diguanylate cyclase domain-containing protein n=1 Tax=Neptunicella plasticusilytica TaxID=3117012 RepID=UPI003A4D2B88